MYDEAMTLKVRLHSLAISENAIFFNYPNYCNNASTFPSSSTNLW